MKAATIIHTSGQNLPFAFGMSALARFCSEQDLKVSQLSEVLADPGPITILSLLWHGFADGYRRERKPFDLTIDDIGDMLDADPELADKCMQVVTESMPQPPADEGKPKAPARLKARG